MGSAIQQVVSLRVPNMFPIPQRDPARGRGTQHPLPYASKLANRVAARPDGVSLSHQIFLHFELSSPWLGDGSSSISVVVHVSKAVPVVDHTSR